MKQGHPHQYLRFIDTPSGRITLEVTATRIAATENRPALVVTTFEDVSTRGFSERLIAAVAHEIRTPPTTMVGYADLLVDESKPLMADDRAGMPRAVITEGFGIANIMDDLTVTARLELGDLNVSAVPVQAAAQVAQVLHRSPMRSAGYTSRSGR